MSARQSMSAEATGARWLGPATLVLIAWFAARAVYLASVTSPAIPPDEIEHYGRSVAFAASLGLPADTPATHRLGPLRGSPYLYHWLMGRVLDLCPLAPERGLLWLRLANVALGLATVGVARRAMARFSAAPLEQLAFLLMLTHTLMFTFLVASVNYDNLANLLAAVAFAALYGYRRDGDPGRLVVLASACLAGTLTKTSFGPLALLLAAPVLWSERRRPRALAARLAGWFAGGRPARLALGALAALLLAANLQLYGANLLRFGRPVPDCTQLLPLEDCLERPNYARNWILDVYRSGELPLEEALTRAAAVEHPSLRRDARYLVRNYQAWQERGRPLPDRLGYAFEWSRKMLRGATGILGHQSLSQPPLRRLAFELILLAAALATARYWRPGDAAGCAGDSILVATSYALILMQLVNYPIYAASGSPSLAVQGRYLFPLLVPLLALASHYLLAPLPPRGRVGAVALLALVFVSGDLPFYLSARTPAWVGGP